MDFKVEGPRNTGEYCRPHGWQTRKFLNSKHSRMAKTVTLYIHLVDLCNKIRELIQFWQDPKNSSIVLFNLSYLSYLMEMYIKPFSYENYCRQSAIK